AIGDRVEAEIQYAFTHRRELRHGLHQRRVGRDLRGDGAVRALLEFGGELAAKPVAEIAFVDRAARELVRDFQGLGWRSRPQPARSDDRGRGQRTGKDGASADGHLNLPIRSPSCPKTFAATTVELIWPI